MEHVALRLGTPRAPYQIPIHACLYHSPVPQEGFPLSYFPVLLFEHRSNLSNMRRAPAGHGCSSAQHRCILTNRSRARASHGSPAAGQGAGLARTAAGSHPAAGRAAHIQATGAVPGMVSAGRWEVNTVCFTQGSNLGFTSYQFRCL